MQPRLSHCLSVTLLALAPLFCSPHPVAEQAGSAHRPFHGTATWFLPNLGACGEVSSEADHIIAMNTPQYKSGGHCHKNVVIKNKANGKSVVAKVLDECPSCGYGCLDLSPSVFKALGNLEDGVLPIAWQWTG
ncbi:hypothetical protein PCANC_04633 [Puccinia coronata f. sp. avenae]|uniref:RlpA-like protein double-psi beta-barrel domain-containing protein n=1 Tax=Puccinia coronata f. sp. avenae TaxID=200324 RepID=A0A2N5SKT1_9BASI|nr:hypothetical protein PCANC_16743 [Puccinia coronata f. sp. avenae]PLW29055.1 hypothetical protein PCASD_16251 [Puccinia coronata f. sp. avenae]PLW55661.1 hypothetical protein PCANC_04633 [Puccinia coronata f. sp. avenae]